MSAGRVRDAARARARKGRTGARTSLSAVEANGRSMTTRAVPETVDAGRGRTRTFESRLHLRDKLRGRRPRGALRCGHGGDELGILPAAELEAHSRDGRHRGRFVLRPRRVVRAADCAGARVPAACLASIGRVDAIQFATKQPKNGCGGFGYTGIVTSRQSQDSVGPKAILPLLVVCCLTEEVGENSDDTASGRTTAGITRRD